MGLATLLVAAPSAPAATFPVTDVTDANDANFPGSNGTCDATGPTGCTLRAAIQEANATAAMDTINFGAALLATDPLLSIDADALGALPAIAQPTLLDGCNGVAGPPCATLQEEPPGGTVDIFRIAGKGVTIRGFAIGNGLTGIDIDGASGALIAGNSIGVPDGGVWKQLDLSNLGPGIRIRDDSSNGVGDNDPQFEGNVIGGDTSASENVISNNGGPAIEVLAALPGGPPGGPTSDLNFIGRNRGTGNGGVFVDLGGDGLGNPSAQNDGILVPQIGLAAPNFVRGTAEPNATLLAFQAMGTAGTSPSSITSYLGTATADADGHWKLEHGLGLGSAARVTALQADAPLAGCQDLLPPATLCNSSELAASAAVDVEPPALSITSGPSGPTSDSTPTFGFAVDLGATVTCAIFWVTEFGPCDDNGSYTVPAPLTDGPHGFFVRAVDEAGNVVTLDHGFIVDTFVRTAIRKAPGERRVLRRASYRFRAEEPGDGDDEERFVEEADATFVCSLDGNGFRPCASPRLYTNLRRGRHVFRVAATDDVGNVDVTPAMDRFTIVRPRRK